MTARHRPVSGRFGCVFQHVEKRLGQEGVVDLKLWTFRWQLKLDLDVRGRNAALEYAYDIGQQRLHLDTMRDRFRQPGHGAVGFNETRQPTGALRQNIQGLARRL